MEMCFFDEVTLEALDKVQKQQHNPCSVILNTPIFKGVLSGNPGFAQLRKILESAMGVGNPKFTALLHIHTGLVEV